MADTDIATKSCTKCGEAKAPSFYYKSSTGAGGLRSVCKACSDIESKRNRAKNPERTKQLRREHHLKNKERDNELSRQYWKNNSERLKDLGKAWYQANIERIKKLRADYREVNREKRRLDSKIRYRKDPAKHLAYWHSRRARKVASGGTITPDDVKWLFDRQKGKCPVCKKPFKEYHIDHIIPLAQGGRNDKSNAQLLHPACNLKKSSKDPIEFMQEQGFLL